MGLITGLAPIGERAYRQECGKKVGILLPIWQCHLFLVLLHHVIKLVGITGQSFTEFLELANHDLDENYPQPQADLHQAKRNHSRADVATVFAVPEYRRGCHSLSGD